MVNFYAPCNRLGMGIHAYNLIKAYSKINPNVSLIPPFGGVSVQDDYVNQWLANRAKISKNDTGIMIFNEPFMAQFSGKVRIGFPVFEMEKFTEISLAAMRTCDYLLTPSHWGKSVLKDNGFDNVYVAPEGYDPEVFYPDYNLKYKLHRIERDGLTFVSVGKLEERKGTKDVVRMVDMAFTGANRTNKKATLILHCFNPFDKDWRMRINELLTNLGFEMHQSIEGRKFQVRRKDNLAVKIPINPFNFPREVANLYRSADFGIFLSRAEGWNLPCMPAESLVVTANGLKEISEVTKKDIAVTHLSHYKNISRTFKNKYNGDIISIKLWNNNDLLKLTPEHPVFVIRREDCPKGTRRFSKIIKKEPKWIEAKHLKKGDLILRASIPTIKHKEVFDLREIDTKLIYDENYCWYRTGYNQKSELKKIRRFVDLKKLAYIFGWYIAEGSEDGRRIHFTLNIQELKVAKKILKEIELIFGVKGNYRVLSYKKVISLYFCSTLLAKFFTLMCGNGAFNKKIPLFFFYGEKQGLKTLINAAVCGDGHKRGDRISYTTVSKMLSNQMIIALQKIGIKGSKHFSRNEYVINWSLKNFNCRHSNKSWWNKYGLAILVKSVNVEKYSGFVYNLEVKDDNSYLLSIASVHNCMECIACGTPALTTGWTGMSEYLQEYPGELNIARYKRKTADDGIWFHGGRGEWRVPDMDEVLFKLIDISKRPEKYLRMEKDCLKSIERFTWENAAKRLDFVLKEKIGIK